MRHQRKKRTETMGKKKKPGSGGKSSIVVSRAPVGQRRANFRQFDEAGLSERGMPTLEELEFDYIRKVLRHVSDNKTRAARILGINRVSLWRKIKSMGLATPVTCSE